MSEKRRGLGRGLGALIPTSSTAERPVDVFFSSTKTPSAAESASATSDEESLNTPQVARLDGSDTSGAPRNQGQDVDSSGLVPVPGATFAEIDVTDIRPNSRQPRTVFDEDELTELVGSILEIGVLQPIVVRTAPDGPHKYELIMGERRWRATQQAGLASVPAIIRETGEDDLLRDALLENLHRSDLNPLEEAAAYRQLLDDFDCTHEELAKRISRSRPQISNTLRLLKLPASVQRRVAARVLSAGHARALLGLDDAEAIERLAQRIVAEGLSVRATEEIVSMGGLETAPTAVRRPRAGGRVAAVDELAGRLSDRFETRVKVDLGKRKGKVTIEFASVEDLNRIIDVMAPNDPGVLRR